MIGTDLIGTGRCGVWWAQARLTDAALLSSAEGARLARLRQPADQRRMITAWTLARTLLGAVLDVPPSAIPVRRHCAECGGTDHGKPLVDGWHFSLSHSGEFVAVAVTQAASVGIDLEYADRARDISRLVRTLFAPGEAASADPRDLLRTWVRKESVTKAVGTGLGTPFNTFAVGGYPAALLTWPDDPALAARTTLADLTRQSAYPAAVTVLAPDVEITEHDGDDFLHRALGDPGR